MNALTLHQPWADMVARGLKVWETRSWRTEKLVGEYLAIHASKSAKNDKVAVEKFPAHYVLQNDPERRPLVHAALVCVVKVVSCHPTEEMVSLWQPFQEFGTPQKKQQIRDALAMGDFSPKRWAWQLELVCQLTGIEGIPGNRRFWKLPASIEEQVAEQMRKSGFAQNAGGGGNHGSSH